MTSLSKISLQNEVSPVLALIAKDMLSLSMSAEKLEQSFGRMGTAMKLALGAGVVAGAGYAAIKVADDLARHGEKLLHQQNVMLRNGQSFAEVTNLTADAYDRITRLVPTATGSDVLRTISELRSVLGDTTEAVAQTPFALKLDAILSNLTGKDSEGSGFALWRALEMKGMTVSDPQGASKLGETMAQIIGASNGKVDRRPVSGVRQTWRRRVDGRLASPYRGRRFGPYRRHGRRHGRYGLLDVLQQRHGRGADVATTA